MESREYVTVCSRKTNLGPASLVSFSLLPSHHEVSKDCTDTILHGQLLIFHLCERFNSFEIQNPTGYL